MQCRCRDLLPADRTRPRARSARAGRARGRSGRGSRGRACRAREPRQPARALRPARIARDARSAAAGGIPQPRCRRSAMRRASRRSPAPARGSSEQRRGDWWRGHLARRVPRDRRARTADAAARGGQKIEKRWRRGAVIGRRVTASADRNSWPRSVGLREPGLRRRRLVAADAACPPACAALRSACCGSSPASRS